MQNFFICYGFMKQYCPGFSFVINSMGNSFTDIVVIHLWERTFKIRSHENVNLSLKIFPLIPLPICSSV